MIFDGREEGVVGRDWAARSYRANLIDMHIPDWDPVFLSRFDSVRYVELLRKAKVETAYKIANWRSSCGPLVATVSAVSTPPTRGYSTQMPPNRLRSRCFTSQSSNDFWWQHQLPVRVAQPAGPRHTRARQGRQRADPGSNGAVTGQRHHLRHRRRLC